MKITFQKKPMTLVGGTLIKVGDKIDFKATNNDFSSFDINKVKGIKVISTMPSLDTGVCDEQTREISKIASKFKNITFIALSQDLPVAQARWCGQAGISNITAVSDYQEREFAIKYGLLIDELKLTHRSLIVLSSTNEVIYFDAKKEITDLPNFKALTNFIETI